jgi:hypothetical protein
MTKKQNPPPEHTKWKKGQSGNPGGRPKLPAELKMIKELTGEEVKRLFAKYARMNKEEISSAVTDKTTPMFELVIAAGLVKAVKDGDYQKLNFILDRTIGKVVEKTEVELPEPVIIRRASGEEIYLAAERKE